MNYLSESTSSSLIQRVRDNDQVAWSRMALLYAPLVYKWTRRLGIPSEDAADIGQEVFRTVALRIGEFRREHKSSFRSWLWQISRNKIGDFLRSQRKQVSAKGGSDSLLNNLATIEVPEAQDDDSQAEDQQEIFASVMRLIKTDFQDRTWKAFWFTTIEEKSVVDIAEQLGMTTKSVRQAKYRVLKRIRDEFEDLL